MMSSAASNRLEYPIVLFSDQNRIYLELPAGKIGKDGSVATQKAQKGNTCAFYAIKRLLTTAQIRTEHGLACSKRRKMITAGGTVFSSPLKYHEARVKANETFLQSKGLNPEKAGRELWHETLKIGMADVPAEYLTRDLIEMAAKQTDLVLAAQKPWYRLEHMEAAATRLMAKGYGLKTILFKEMNTMNGLIQALKTKGPLMVHGFYGSPFYAGEEPVIFKDKVGDHALYGWKKGTPTTPDMGIVHAIVVVGADVKEDKKLVYWINPEDCNDPKKPDSQRVFVSSFESFMNRMHCVEGLPIDKISPQSREVVSGALYNPAFAPKSRL